uniref:Uncharacterized protein n=1 Tax=Heterorhabditis bacteriophora TaxID=37862 RepID=A0A1I7WUT9_HETBA
MNSPKTELAAGSTHASRCMSRNAIRTFCGKLLLTPDNQQHQKFILCIWWDMKSVLFYEFLQADSTVTVEHYSR